jgi:hypothetical protein
VVRLFGARLQPFDSGVDHVGALRNIERRIELLATILNDAAQPVVR